MMLDIKRNARGWVFVDKPSGCTSMHVTHRIKRLFQIKKAGHAGTLDPLASGMLPVAMGLDTALIPWLMSFSKTYTFTVAWGAMTSTDDLLGDVLRVCTKRPTECQIKALLPQWKGEILQVPPIYCAAKKGGVPAYARARQGEDVQLLPRKVVIHAMDMIEHLGDTTRFQMECGTGTYVRSVARDMADALGMCGYIHALRRIRVGPFDGGVRLGDLEQSQDAELQAHVHPSRSVLQGMPDYVVSADEKVDLWNGKKIAFSCPYPLTQNVIACYDKSGCLVALAKVGQGWLVPTRCFIGNI